MYVLHKCIEYRLFCPELFLRTSKVVIGAQIHTDNHERVNIFINSWVDLTIVEDGVVFCADVVVMTQT